MSDDDFEPVRGNIRSRAFRRVTHGTFLRIRDGAEPEMEWLRELDAWRLTLPESAVFTGLTAAHLLGWATPPLPSWVPVWAAVPPGGRRPQRPGLIVSRLHRGRAHRPLVVRDQPVDEPAEVLLRCARDLDLLDLVPMVESALRAEHLTREDITEACGRARPGVRLLRTALALAEVRSESAMETVLRLFFRCLEVDVEVQPDLHDADGRFVARADLRLKGTRYLVEYDGAHHRSRPAQRDDLRRDRKLADADYVRRAYTADDILNHPAVVMSEMDRLLGRTADLGRLRQWRTLLDLSSYSEVGLTRLRSRWKVPMAAFRPA